jgi:5-methyltetrahydropteroyltriglutamate--homocysteine methyltransferase
MITAHTDVVGSLLRPVALRKARGDWMAGRLSHTQFKSIEDRAVDEAVCLPEAAGLDIVTDGGARDGRRACRIDPLPGGGLNPGR